MITQVCDSDQKIHLSGFQMSLYSSLRSFSEGGHELSLLVQFCWIMFVLHEMGCALHFARALLSARRGPTTFVRAKQGGEEDSHHKSMVHMLVIARLKKLSLTRVVTILMFVVIPRILVAFLLGGVGVRFLGSSQSCSDMLLNSLALAFILDLDEMFYSVFVPRRVKCVVKNLEAMPVKPQRLIRMTRFACINGLAKLLLTVATVWLINVHCISPIFERITEAQNVMCSGNRDFVYAQDPLTGNTHAVRTVTEKNWTQNEMDVLQMAAPTLNRKYWPNLRQDVFDAAFSDQTTSIIYPGNARSLTTAPVPFTDEYFGLLKSIDVATPKDAAGLLLCVDYANAHSEEVARWKIGQVVGNASITSCEEAEEAGYCGKLEMDALRALCPSSCGCDKSMAYSSAGFFAATSFGCPEQCGTLLEISEEVDHMDVNATTLPCSDLDDSLFSVALPGAIPFIGGIFDYNAKVDHGSYRRYLETGLPRFGEYLNIAPELYSDYTEAMFNETTKEEFQEFKWTIGLGIPHPRGLVGCEFWTSWEVTAILGLNLCDVGNFRSIRGVCATSCGCQLSNNTGPECPVACAK